MLDAFTKERQEKEAEQAKLEEEQKERRIWCARAKDDLRELKEASYLYDYDDSGEKVVYSKEAREKATPRVRGRNQKAMLTRQGSRPLVTD